MKLHKFKYRQKLLAYFGLGIVTIIVGLSFIFVKIGLRNADTYDLLAHRFSIAFLLVVGLKLFGIVKIPKVATRDWISILLISLFYPILCFGFQTIGMETSSVSQAGIIFALTPVFTIIAGAVFLKENTTILQKSGVMISVTSLVLIFLYKSSGNNQSWLGSVFLILSVLCIVGYYMIGKKIMQRYNSISITSIMITIAFVTFNSIAITKRIINGDISTFFEPLNEPTFLYSVLYLGILSSLLTSFLSNYALAFVPTSEVSIFNNLNPVITILGGIIILSEQLYVFQLVGMLGVFLGISMVLFKKSKNKQILDFVGEKNLSKVNKISIKTNCQKKVAILHKKGENHSLSKSA